MRTIKTSKGKTFDVEYAWAPTMDGACGIGLLDTRPLHRIAADFSGLTHIHFTDTETGEWDFDGYTVLSMISRAGGIVRIKLVKGEETNGH